MNDFSKKDDAFTIKLPGSELVFTRYLYVKEEVRIALLVSILNKSDDAIFWAYEMYYSGFKYELLNLIWKIYYDFFATLNPAYEAYLLKKHKELANQTSLIQDRTISAIIQDLLFRPFNADVFMLRNICALFEIDITYHTDTKILQMNDVIINMEHWISENDYRTISHWILNVNNGRISVVNIYNICLDIFNKELKLTKSKLEKEFISALRLTINPNEILLAKIMILFSKKESLKKGRSIYINVEQEDIISYETIVGTKELKHYNILEQVCICGIDDLRHLSLFKLTRNKYNLREKYWYQWEYHASFSPLWSQRLKQYRAYPDYIKQKVIFIDDNLMQEFYSLYGLEPDEQKQEIQNKSIIEIEKLYDWKWFNDKYKKNGLIEVYDEELDEFNNDGLIY